MAKRPFSDKRWRDSSLEGVEFDKEGVEFDNSKVTPEQKIENFIHNAA